MKRIAEFVGDELGVAFAVLVTLAGIAGWVLNIAKMLGEPSGLGVMLVRFAGIFVFPLGAVAGWL